MPQTRHMPYARHMPHARHMPYARHMSSAHHISSIRLMPFARHMPSARHGFCKDNTSTSKSIFIKEKRPRLNLDHSKKIAVLNFYIDFFYNSINSSMPKSFKIIFASYSSKFFTPRLSSLNTSSVR